MKNKTIFKIVLIVLLTLFLAFWIAAFIKVCPGYANTNLDVSVPFYPDYEETIYDKIFDRVCPGLVKLKLISFVNKAVAVESFDTDLSNLKNNFPALVVAYDRINIFQAWDIVNSKLRSFSTVSIGILDTGFESSHLEFDGVVIDMDSFIDHRDGGHGTQVLGIIGANNNAPDIQDNREMNGILSGVTENYRTVSRHAIGNDGFNLMYEVEKMVTDLQVEIINISGGSTKCSFKFFFVEIPNACISDEDFAEHIIGFQKLFNSFPDVLFINSAGNDNTNALNTVPGGAINLSNAITVGATDLDDNRANFGFLRGGSNFGATVDISAPGIGVYAPRPGNDYDTNFSGTSASAPLVTGVAAILKALEPEYQKHSPGLVMTPAKIKEILQLSADPIKTDKPLGNGCFDPNDNPEGFNGCRLNAHRAVSWLLPPTPVILNTPVAVPAP